MRSPKRAPGRRSSRPIAPGGSTTTPSITMPTGRARTGDTAPRTCYGECWAGRSQKRCSRGLCTPRSLPARLIAMATFGENGLVCQDVSVWVYENTLKVEYQATALSLYSLTFEPDTGQIADVKNPRRIGTHFRSPQLDLWQLSETEWLLPLRRPEPVAQKKPGQLVALGEQLVLAE